MSIVMPAIRPTPLPSAVKILPSTRCIPGSRKIRSDLLPGFSRKLAAMLEAGLPIVAALNALERQARHPVFKTLIGHIIKSIENGTALSESLMRFPSVFDDIYTNLVCAGEKNGQLAESLARLSSLLEASARLRRKVKSAMIYPVVVLGSALLITAGMIIFVVPVFANMFASFNQKLPAPTLLLLRLSDFLRHFFPFVIIALVAGITIFRKWKKTPQGMYILDQLALNLPVFGDLIRKVATARFAMTFGQLIHGGVPILDALAISSGATGNRVAAQLVMNSRGTVERGEPLSSAMINNTAFDPMLVDMLQAGEKTGKVDEMMNFTAVFFDEEVNSTLNSLTAMLEPLLMLVLGAIIGTILICMFLPIFKMPGIVG